MKHYSLDHNIVKIKDFSHAKKFASFLPMIAGEDGKPLWLFYVNEGQCIASFGVNDKETPLLPFYSATLSYQNTALKCFRTIVYLGNTIVEPFIDKGETELKIERSKISISFENKLLRMDVTYSTISHKPYPGLIRKVSIKNKTDKKIDAVIDGLPIYLPKGLNNYSYTQMTTLATACCKVDFVNDIPFFKYTNKGADNSIYLSDDSGSTFFTYLNNKNKIIPIIDKDIVFKNESMTEIYKNNEVLQRLSTQIPANKIPSAFSYIDANLSKNEVLEFASFYSCFDDEKSLLKVHEELSLSDLKKCIDETEKLVEELLPNIETNNPILDEYVKQSFLDNYLRGGYPKIIDDKLCYLYSRKHGDLERDYNAFVVPNSYFSSGLGNFRDLNQNRRNDLLFEPRIKDYNLYLFFSLIENNGFNPLLVDVSILSKRYDSYEDALEAIKNRDDSAIKANYKEGYWIDHWVYNIDLLENYLSVYPDKINELLNATKYRFFDSGVHIKPRSERYCLTPHGIRQYNSLELLNEHSDWLMNNGKVVYVNLASKIFDLILKKFATLDVDQIGLEMFADKPGWNDSCNGLPGLFASSTAESIELIRLIKLFKSLLNSFDGEIHLTEASNELYEGIKSIKESGFAYWDKQHQLLEKFEEEYRNKTNLVKIAKPLQFLNKSLQILDKGIKAAKSYGDIIPTFLIHEVTDYEMVDGKIKVKAFKTIPLPAFLESPARLLKLGKKYVSISELNAINNSDLLDKKFKIFKTSISLENASSEIGRIKSFSPGWLERESDFLHMSFKYLLGILKCGYYKQFFKYAKTNIPCFMNPEIYGRSIFENVSFIVPSNHLNKDLWGSGHYARLTGANTEIVNMYQLVLFGESIFEIKDGKVKFAIKCHIPLSLFKDNHIKVTLLGMDVDIYNPNNKDYFEQDKLLFILDKEEVDYLDESLLDDIRNKKNHHSLEIRIS